jgi:predicted transcriptional regulator
VFSKAERMYSTLASKRDYLNGELAKVDGALSSLERVIAAKDGGPVRRGPPAGSGRAKRSAASAPASGGKPTLAQVVMAVLGRSGAPMSASDIAASVKKESRGIGTAGLQKVLRDLRDRGQVKASGKAKRFHYQAARGGGAVAKPAAAKPAAAKPAKKKAAGRKARGARGGGGGPTVRDLILAALPKGRALRIADIVSAVVAKRSDVKRGSVETIIHRLRRSGDVKSSGASGDYRYSRA